MEKEQEVLARLRQDIVDNNLHVKAIIQVRNWNCFISNTSGTSSLFI